MSGGGLAAVWKDSAYVGGHEQQAPKYATYPQRSERTATGNASANSERQGRRRECWCMGGGLNESSC